MSGAPPWCRDTRLATAPTSADRPIADLARRATRLHSGRVKWIEILGAGSALLLATPAARGQSDRLPSAAGDQYELTLTYETTDEDSEGSSATSSGRTVLIERVIAVRDDGFELEYDLPQDAISQDRAREWKFPARVLRQSAGRTLLLNRAELEARVERWLEAAKWTREVCGRWIFTWNAFRIDCDPEAVIEEIEAFDLRSADLREGAPYRDPDAAAPGTLARVADGAEGTSFATVMEVDAAAVTRSRAEADVITGEIMRKPVTLEAALRERGKESVSGTIRVTFERGGNGDARRRTKVTRLNIVGPDRREAQTRTETLERRPLLAPAGHQK